MEQRLWILIPLHDVQLQAHHAIFTVRTTDSETAPAAANVAAEVVVWESVKRLDPKYVPAEAYQGIAKSSVNESHNKTLHLSSSARSHIPTLANTATVDSRCELVLCDISLEQVYTDHTVVWRERDTMIGKLIDFKVRVSSMDLVCKRSEITIFAIQKLVQERWKHNWYQRTDKGSLAKLQDDLEAKRMDPSPILCGNKKKMIHINSTIVMLCRRLYWPGTLRWWARCRRTVRFSHCVQWNWIAPFSIDSCEQHSENIRG